MEEDKKEEVSKIVEELPVLLVAHAYRKLKSGEEVSASEMKVCLDICKTYSQPVSYTHLTLPTKGRV